MSIMKQKLVNDFFQAVEVDKKITLGAVDIEEGVFVLKDMIRDVRDVIDTMDIDASNVLKHEIEELDKQNSSWKDEKRKGTKVADPTDERNLKLTLLKADHKKYKQELVFIQKLAYKKGWFD